MSDLVLIVLIVGVVFVIVFAIAAFAPRREPPTSRYLDKVDKTFSTPTWTSETTYNPEVDKKDTD